MRNFYDTWSVILDDKGQPLHGRISFYEANTTTLKSIYDVDGNELSNPIYCNKVPTAQILLDESDYTIRYERYIGNGNMESDENASSWFLYKTEIYKLGELKQTITTGLFVNTIDELQQLTDMEDGQEVTVYGYYTAGDCPERNYVWHENGTYSYDGGIFIKSDSSSDGAWVLNIPGSYIDVRWYGDIADKSSTPTSATSNLGQRTKAAVGANMFHKDLFFPNPNKDSNAFYIFDGSNTVSVTKDIICDNGVRFVIKTGTAGTKVQCHEMKKCDRYLFVAPQGSTIGGYYLQCDWINASWFSSSTATAEGAQVGYILDEITSPLSFSNTNIRVENTPSYAVTFNNCNITDCNHMLSGSVTMQNMTIHTDWFTDDYDWRNLTLVNCDVRLENCVDADTYITLKNKLGETDYGDLGEQEIDATIGTGNVIIENGSGTITIDAEGTTNLEIHNFSGTIKKSSETYASVTINAIDSWLTIDTDTITQIDSLQIRRGNLSGAAAVQVLSEFYAEDADILVHLALMGILSPIVFKHCRIYSYLNVISHIKNLFIGNIFDANSTLNYVADSSDMLGVFQDNFIRQTSNGWTFSSNIADTCVHCCWVDNHSDMDTMFITLDRTNFLTKESEHDYTYSGNVGKNVIQPAPTWSETLTPDAGTSTESAAEIIYGNKTYHFVNMNFTPDPTDTDKSTRIIQGAWSYERNEAGTGFVTNGYIDPNYYTTEFSMFTVGTDITDVPYELTATPAYYYPGSETTQSAPGISQAIAFTTILSTFHNKYMPSNVLACEQILWNKDYKFRLFRAYLGYVYGFDYFAANNTPIRFAFHIKKAIE